MTDHDVLIITYLLHDGNATVHEISRQTAISYSTCEYLCNHLLRIGLLISKMEKDKQVFCVAPEEEFVSWMQHQKLKVLDEYGSAIGDMQQFFKSYREKSWKPEFLYFQGVEGIKEIYEDMLSSSTPIYGWRDIELLQKMLGKSYLDNYIEKRVEKGISSFAISPDNEVNRQYSAKDQKRSVKFIKALSLPGEIRMYDGKTAIVSFHKDHPVGFMLTSELIFNIFKAIFDEAWRK